AIDELGEDRALVLEVEIEGPARDARPRDDVVDGGVVVTAPRENIAGCSQDLLASFGLRRLGSAFRARHRAQPRSPRRARCSAPPSRVWQTRPGPDTPPRA